MQKETSDGAAARPVGRLLSLLRANRKLEAALYGALALIVIGIYAFSSSGSAEKKAGGALPAESVANMSEAEVEQRLTRVLSSIRGAGEVRVMITYETGGELVAAMTTSTDSDSATSIDGARESSQTRVTEETTVALRSGSGGDEPIVLMERRPAVRGVIVVAEGAANVTVRMDLERAVRAVLDIPLSSIEVFELNGAERD